MQTIPIVNKLYITRNSRRLKNIHGTLSKLPFSASYTSPWHNMLDPNTVLDRYPSTQCNHLAKKRKTKIYVKPMLHEQVSRIKDMRFPRHLSVNCMACASFFHEGNLSDRENRGNLSTRFIHC